jgi:rhodanese-related sulfurtransferase
MVEDKLCPELSVEEVAELIAQSEAMIIDVNPRRRWSSGHLPGAANLDPGAFTGADLPADKSTMLVFYCNEPGGTASRFAAQKAARLGYAHIFIMPAGLRGWMAAGKRVMAGR